MYGFKHYISQPTRITPTSRLCLDNIISNMYPDEICTGVYDPSLADHSGIFLKIKNVIKETGNEWVKRGIMNSERIPNFSNRLTKTNWHDLDLDDYDRNETTRRLVQLSYPSHKI